ncbi:hypothetical protein [Streptomyces sp. NPDC001297]|uniref:hypothetical protein n=1 Tax=Streptomyces sp. NPDC001297 TaxID=3364559 RepID=UPI0036D126C1
MNLPYLRLAQFSAAHGDPSGWSPADFDAYLDLSLAVTAAPDTLGDDEAVSTLLLNEAVYAFDLNDEYVPGPVPGPRDEMRQLDFDFEAIVTEGLLSADYEPYPPAGHTYPRRG